MKLSQKKFENSKNKIVLQKKTHSKLNETNEIFRQQKIFQQIE